MGARKAGEIETGDRFPSPRSEEGTVTAVCSYGDCKHGHTDRRMSVHVRDGSGGQFFVAMNPDEVVHVCSTVGCAFGWQGDVPHSELNWRAG